MTYSKVRIKFSNLQVYWYFYFSGWGKTGPAHSFPPHKCFNLSINCLVFRFMLLFHCILTFMKDIFKSQNQVFNPTRLLVLLHCGVGKNWAGPFFPPSLIFRSSIDCFVFRFMLLFHSILTFMKDLYQSENQVFNPTRLLVLLHCGVGKDWVGPFFPPSKMFRSFYLSSRLLDYVILLLYLNSLNLYQAENQVFKPTSLFVIVGWGKTGPAHSFPPP